MIRCLRAHKSSSHVSNKPRVLLAIGDATEALALAQIAFIAHDKMLGRDHDSTKGSARITAERSTRSVAPLKRRRYGSSMGSQGKEQMK